ncbi:hypothetical protein [Azospirillum ramasamyi]|uniref:Secreted protein n=1 Tax=Azospirillum ramasamyi TaxID=682998 RepID=A0A2U9SC66_9PROT|nr:hypothetical protein [Azospirillum ramasamyi]AWU96413.1 hypothetical protein DM194_19235 [Azospirillum ramasamyi]
MLLEPIALAVALCLATAAATVTASAMTSVWQRFRAPDTFAGSVRTLRRPANLNRPPRRASRLFMTVYQTKD